MLLTIDIGNTNVTLGVYLGKDLQLLARLNTDPRRTSDQYAMEIDGILAFHGVARSDIDGVILDSVVPIVGATIARAARDLYHITPLEVGPGIKTGLNIKIDNPAQLGADLVAGAVGASLHAKMPCIICDLGTATTLSVMDRQGNFLGGPIAAGLRATLDALAGGTAQLPYIDLKAPAKVIGTNSVESMQSGIVIGAAAMIDGLIDRINAELGEEANVIATGGLAPMVVPLCTHKIEIYDNLLLEGIRDIYYRNQPEKA